MCTEPITKNKGLEESEGCGYTMLNLGGTENSQALYLGGVANAPFENRLKIRGKNRLRKFWQRTQYTPIKAEINRLQRVIRTDLRKIKEHIFGTHFRRTETSMLILFTSLSLAKAARITYSTLLLGFRSLVYGTKEKADLFVENFEESFTENRTPCNDDHIDKVDRTLCLLICDLYGSFSKFAFKRTLEHCGVFRRPQKSSVLTLRTNPLFRVTGCREEENEQ
ncbi:hypothetical protein TNCV_4548171 [Trichonephila clavipes]|nr:hypothetical protein TNCV_4548171 [Trichonephila clavipes]